MRNKREIRPSLLPVSQEQRLLELYNCGNYETLIIEANQLLKDYKHSLLLHNLLGIANQHLQHYEAAVKSYTSVLQIRPNFPEVLINLGTCFYHLGNHTKALEYLNSAAQLKPNSPEVYIKLGNIHKSLNNTDIALDAYQNALQNNPNSPEVKYNIGNLFKQKNKLISAINAYHDAIKLKPDFFEAYYNLGNALRDAGDFEKAAEAYKNAIRIRPNNVIPYNSLGNVLKAVGKVEDATEIYKQATFVDETFAGTYWNLSSTTDVMTEAKAWLKKCLEFDPEYKSAILSLAAIEYYEGNRTRLQNILTSPLKNDPITRSISWVVSLPKLPELFFNRWALFRRMTELSQQDRPFYEFGVWKGEAFKYLIKTFKKGYGFDTFTGLPETWHSESAGTYDSHGNIPQVEGGEFIVGEFKNSLPIFFSETRPLASVINFDADLYSSTICALNHCKGIIDNNTILIFDEFLVNSSWENDEYKALEEFCAENQYEYEVIAISLFSKQAAVKIRDLKQEMS